MARPVRGLSQAFIRELLTVTGTTSILIHNNTRACYSCITLDLVIIMTDSKKENMDLAALEARVDELIRTVDHLKHENSALRNQQDSLVNERATLIEKTEQARARIESMISRLRAMETRS